MSSWRSPPSLLVVWLLLLLLMSLGPWSVSGENPGSLTSRALNVTLQPINGIRMLVSQSTPVNISLQFSDLESLDNSTMILQLRIEDSAVATFNGSSGNTTISIDPSDWIPLPGSPRSSPSVVYSSAIVQVTGKRVGITSLSVTVDLRRSPRQRWILEPGYSVRVRKTAPPLNRGLRLGTMAAMALNFMTFGCKLRVGDLKKYARRPFGIFVGFLLQYGLMPTITYLMGLAAHLPAHFAFALFAVGCAPGGGPSNLCTVILNGDLHMSIIMTFISTVAAIGMIPLWMFTLGRVVLQTGYPASEIQMPWNLLGIAVVWFSLPTAIGMAIGRFLPRLASALVLIVRPIAFLFLLVQVAVFIYFNYPVLYFADSWQLLAVTAATPYIAYVVSFVLALVVFRRTRADSVTIMIETGIQNITFAYFLIVATLPQPDGDIASVVPLLVIFFTYGPIFFVVFPVAAVVNRMNSKRRDQGYALSGVNGGHKVKVDSRASVSSETQLASEPEEGSKVSLESVNRRYLLYDVIGDSKSNGGHV